MSEIFQENGIKSQKFACRPIFAWGLRLCCLFLLM